MGLNRELNADSSSSRTSTSPSPSSHASVLLSVKEANCVVPSDDGGERTIFSGLAFDVFAGDVIDITGPSGAGKSSLLTTIAQLNSNGHADLTLRGRDARQMSPQQWRRSVAYVHQKPILVGSTIREALLFPWKRAIPHPAEDRPSDDQLRSALNEAGLADISLDRPIHDVSGGQLARISLLRTLLTHPAVLLADEIDAALDSNADQRIEHFIYRESQERGMAVIRVRHRAGDGLANRVWELSDGHLHARAHVTRSLQK